MLHPVKQHLRDIQKTIVPARLRRRFPYSLFGRALGDRLENRAKHRLFGSLAPLVPSVEDMFDGRRSLKSFKQDGDEFLRIYKEICGLAPNEKILDVGCGIGRKTIPLTRYLTSDAAYEGIDINKTGIEWCQREISSRFPNFRFQHIDVYNKFYNPDGPIAAREYKFAFNDNSFDFAVLGSVFTHMYPEDAVNYLYEVHRVLRPRGRCLITYFLLTDQSLKGIAEGKSTLDFKRPMRNSRIVLPEMPEFAIAYEETWVRKTYPRIGLQITHVDYGSWSGGFGRVTYQDLVLATKE